MDPEAHRLLDWVSLGKFALVAAVVFGFVLWRWLEKRALDDIHRKADELEREERDNDDRS